MRCAVVVGRIEHRLLDVDADPIELVDEPREVAEPDERPVVDLGAHERGDVARQPGQRGRVDPLRRQLRVAVVDEIDRVHARRPARPAIRLGDALHVAGDARDRSETVRGVDRRDHHHVGALAAGGLAPVRAEEQHREAAVLPEIDGQARPGPRVALAPAAVVEDVVHDVEGLGKADLDRRCGRAERGGRHGRDEQEPREPERGRERPDREVAARTARVRTHGPRLHHDQAAVDGEHLAGDEGRLIRHEEGDGVSDLLGRAETAERGAGA